MLSLPLLGGGNHDFLCLGAAVVPVILPGFVYTVKPSALAKATVLIRVGRLESGP